jgi:MarR family transcriptional regulator, transcriptional regulator for hemolysin
MYMATDTTPPPATEGTSCLTSNLGWMLDSASHAFGSELTAVLAPLGLGQRGFCVMSSAIDAEYTQTQLAAMIGVDKTTMVVTVDELERLGLAERVPSPTDRRARVIRVTDAGRRRVAEGLEILSSVQESVLASLPDDEREVFVRALMRLVTGRLADVPECHPPLRRREQRA